MRYDKKSDVNGQEDSESNTEKRRTYRRSNNGVNIIWLAGPRRVASLLNVQLALFAEQRDLDVRTRPVALDILETSSVLALKGVTALAAGGRSIAYFGRRIQETIGHWNHPVLGKHGGVLLRAPITSGCVERGAVLEPDAPCGPGPAHSSRVLEELSPPVCIQRDARWRINDSNVGVFAFWGTAKMDRMGRSIIQIVCDPIARDRVCANTLCYQEERCYLSC